MSGDVQGVRNPDPRGLGVVVFEEMKKHADKIAHIDASTDTKETYAELQMRAIRCAQALQSHKITMHQDVISICSENNMDCYVPLIAAFYLELKVAPFDPRLSVVDTMHLLELVHPKIMFCCPESVPLIEEAIKMSGVTTEIVVFGTTNKYIPFADFTKPTGKEQEFKPKVAENIHDTALIMFSSGTTGLSKGICLTHYGLLHQTMDQAKSADTDYNRMHYTSSIDMPEVILSYTRLCWISATLTLLSSIFYGSCRILVQKFEHETIFRTIHHYKVNFLHLPPYYTYKITEHPEFNVYDNSQLKMLLITGGSVIEQQVKRLRKFFPHTLIFHNYGLTETTEAGTGFYPATDELYIHAKPTSCGRIMDGVKFKIVDLDTEEPLGPNKQGEMRLKAPSVMKGYHKHPELSEKMFDSEGYLKTGDIAYYDDDNYFYIVDRIKDRMKYHAWQFTPGELEGLLLHHPDVKEAVVISIPHQIDGDHAMGIVVLKDGAKVTEKELTDFVDGQVVDYKRLRGGVKFVKSMPQTPSGKYKKMELRHMVIEKKI